jgi:hypothetical protein
MTTAKQQWTAEAVETTLTAQGIALAPGRAERIARGQAALLDGAAADPLRTSLGFDADPTGFVQAVERCK